MFISIITLLKLTWHNALHFKCVILGWLPLFNGNFTVELEHTYHYFRLLKQKVITPKMLEQATRGSEGTYARQRYRTFLFSLRFLEAHSNQRHGLNWPHFVPLPHCFQAVALWRLLQKVCLHKDWFLECCMCLKDACPASCSCAQECTWKHLIIALICLSFSCYAYAKSAFLQ